MFFEFGLKMPTHAPFWVVFGGFDPLDETLVNHDKYADRTDGQTNRRRLLSLAACIVVDIRRRSVSFAIRALRRADVRVHAHDPLHCRRPVPAGRLAPVAERVRRQDAYRRQRRGVYCVRGPGGGRQLAARARPRRAGDSLALLRRGVAGRRAAARLRAADVRRSVRTAADRLGRSLLAHLPPPQASTPASRSHRQQPTVRDFLFRKVYIKKHYSDSRTAWLSKEVLTAALEKKQTKLY